MKIVFIGQAPSRETDGKPPFTGKCGAKLAELIGISQEEMLQRYQFVNILNKWPGASKQGDLFPMDKARIAAAALRKKFQGRVIILLGANVARAFRLTHLQYLRKVTLPLIGASIKKDYVFVVPHPSGINRWYNDPKNKLKARVFLSWLDAVR